MICDQLALERHDPLLASTLAAIDPDHPAAGDAIALQIARDRIRSYLEFHREHPYRVMPPDATQGPLTIGVQRANGAPIRRQLEHFAQHLGIFAATGFGKTTLIASLLPQLLDAGVHLFIVDRKDDTRGFAARDERFLILHPDIACNIIQQPKGISRAEHIATLIACFARAFFGGEHLKQVLTDALQQAFVQREQPALADVMAILQAMGAKGDTFSRRDAITGVILRLQRFAALCPGMYHTRAGLTLDDLFTHSLYLPITTATEASEFAVTFLIHDLLFHQRQAQRRGGLAYMIVLDEGLSTWNAHASNIDRQPLLSYVQSMVREYAIGMIVTSTSVQLLDPLLKANLGTQIVMNLTSAAESSEIARTFGLSPEEYDYLNTRLVRGECIIKLADDWRHPILATFPRTTTEKSVSTSDWSAAIERTNRLAERRALAAREGTASTGQPKPSHARAPSSSPPATVAPAVDHTIAPNDSELTFSLNTRKVAPNKSESTLSLNPRERKILTYVAQRGILLVTELHAELHLHAMQESRTRKNLRALGLIEEHRITTRAGRGGISTALTATKKAHEELRIPRAHLGKGGPAHRYYLRELRDHLGATLEVHETDAVVTIAPNNERHARLQRAIGIAHNEGDTIAIEVEVSNPRVTAQRIAERTKHFTHTIVATLPQHLAALRTTHAHVISILDLLERIRP
jgi:Helicase HerA, central domain